MVCYHLIGTLFVTSIFSGLQLSSARELIYHGSQSVLGQWPCHAAMFHRRNDTLSYACGATIISLRHVLTAAHCSYSDSRQRSLSAKEVLIRAGISEVRSFQTSLQERNVEQIYAHEGFSRATLENDIALLKLDRDFTWTDHVKSVHWWIGDGAEEAIAGQKGFVVGWGSTETEQVSNVLKHAVMPVVSRKVCEDSDPGYYTKYLFERKTFCAGFRNGTTAGPGDSGGGLYLEADGKWTLRGIVSNAKVDDGTTYYVVFTDVSFYTGWIQSKFVGKDSGGAPEQNYAVCGRKKERKIIRKKFKDVRDWPWLGEVYRNGSQAVQLCEAVIISENFMLSPADVYDEEDVQDSSKLSIVFKVFLKSQYQAFQMQRISKLIRHEHFDQDTRSHNIALIELRTPLRFSELLRPICFNSEHVHRSSEGQLGELVDRIRPADFCNKLLNTTNTPLCFELPILFTGPVPDFLYQKVHGSWYLRGIAYNVTYIAVHRETYAGNYERSYEGYLTSFVDVIKYAEWINRNIGKVDRSQTDGSLEISVDLRQIADLVADNVSYKVDKVGVTLGDNGVRRRWNMIAGRRNGSSS